MQLLTEEQSQEDEKPIQDRRIVNMLLHNSDRVAGSEAAPSSSQIAPHVNMSQQNDKAGSTRVLEMDVVYKYILSGIGES
jgi:hypothetical protein